MHVYTRQTFIYACYSPEVRLSSRRWPHPRIRNVRREGFSAPNTMNNPKSLQRAAGDRAENGLVVGPNLRAPG